MSDHHTKEKGDVGVSYVIHDLTKKGFVVCLPLTEHAQFDLVVVGSTGVYRVQVKFRTSEKGYMQFNMFNTWGNVSKGCVMGSMYTSRDVDVIAVTDGTVVAYLKVEDIERDKVKTVNIRVAPPKTNQRKKIRSYTDFQDI